VLLWTPERQAGWVRESHFDCVVDASKLVFQLAILPIMSCSNLPPRWPPLRVVWQSVLLPFLVWFGLCGGDASAAPSVTNVSFSQQSGTRLVTVTYDLAGGTSSVSLLVSSDNGATYNVPVKSVTGAVGDGVTAGTGKKIIWDAGTDWAGQSSNQIKMRVVAWDLRHEGAYPFVKIPGGAYQMGNLIGDSDILDAGTVSVTLNPYYMAIHPTTKAQWDIVRTWATGNGYTGLATGVGKAADHPVQTVKWYDVVKWANAASEREGLTPCYKFNGTVYRTGTSDAVTCDWSANGYRLPTEAEWEVAARGGLSGKRFPWGDTILHSQANYLANSTHAYDLSGALNDYHPAYKTGGEPYTSPVGSFAANGYGLYDVAGNVTQFCWDWYGPEYSGGSDPRGPSSGSKRVTRGGYWGIFDVAVSRTGQRNNRGTFDADWSSGFRLARGRP
jgi:sulfatase modifying factor 1